MTQALPFLILGHRGCRNADFQQNSYPAFEEALSGADGLETDASQSQDGVVYLVHDTTFRRQAEYTLEEHLDPASAARVAGRRLDQMHSTEIETLRLKNGEPIPRLDRLLESGRHYPGAVFNIELKADNSAVPVVDTVRRAVAAGHVRAGQVIVSSFNHPALAWVREHAPELRIGMLFTLETEQKNLLYPWSGNTTAFYVPFARERLDDPLTRAIAPDFINLALETISVANVAAIGAARPAGKIIAWTLREPSSGQAETVLRQLAGLAGKGILHAWITDEPRLRKAALAALSS